MRTTVNCAPYNHIKRSTISKGTYTPQLKDELITRLYHVARKFHLPMTTVLNLTVAIALETLEGSINRSNALPVWRSPEKARVLRDALNIGMVSVEEMSVDE